LPRTSDLARPIEHQHAAAILERAGVEGGNHGVELLGNLASRGQAQRSPKERQQRLADSASTKHDRIMRFDLLPAPRIGARDGDRREPPVSRISNYAKAYIGAIISDN